MDPRSTRTIAFLASTLTGHGSDPMYDHQTRTRYAMRSWIGERDIDVHDAEMRHYFTGTREADDWTLYDFTSDDFLRFTMRGDAFLGYDFGSGAFYEGTIRNGKVSIWDLTHEEFFCFSPH